LAWFLLKKQTEIVPKCWTAERVIEKYESGKGKGWGALAKSLGIRPGSKEFHALKQGHDLYGEKHNGKRRKGKAKGKK
jgi:hypothetical protein